VTIASAPQSGETGGVMGLIWGRTKAEYFWFAGLTGFRKIRSDLPVLGTDNIVIENQNLVAELDRLQRELDRVNTQLAFLDRPIHFMLRHAASGRPSAVAVRLARMFGQHFGPEVMRRRARRIQELIKTLGPLAGLVVTAGGSIYTGLKGVLGHW
jgi:hypothetical protein